jgi:AAT family amino acid transporter/GABA permease
VSLRILIFYIASISIIVSVAPWTSAHVGVSPFTSTLELIRVPGSAFVMSIVAVTAVLSCLNSGIYITSRMLYELARRGDAPASLAATSANKVPRLGILLCTAAGMLAALASIVSPNGVFLFLVNASGAIILFIYIIIACGQIRLREQHERAGDKLTLKMWLFPWLSYAVIAGIVIVLLVMAFTPGQRNQLLLSSVSVFITLAAYRLRRRQPSYSR